MWKVTPYYITNSGSVYSGSWVGVDLNDTSYFEPTIHTFDKLEIQGNNVVVNGSVLSGSDNLVSQGFKYWPLDSSKNSTYSGNMKDGECENNEQTPNSAPMKTPYIPSNAKIVEASGQVMTASLMNLKYDTMYNFVAFATTSEGEAFYGDVLSFKTEESANPSTNNYDVNLDSGVDIGEVVSVIDKIADPAREIDADVNHDGVVNITDVVAIINIIAGGGTTK